LKQSEPNMLRRELARSQEAGPHPDADMLTAFTEDALSERERKQLMAHLAVCADCREVLSVTTLAAPEPVAADTADVLPRPVHPPLRTWLPWIVTAAVVVIVSSAVLLHERKQEFKPPSENNASVAATATVQAPAQPDKQLQTTIAQVPKPIHNKPASPKPAAKTAEPAQQAVDSVILPEDREPSNKAETNLQNLAPGSRAIAGTMSTAAIPQATGASPVAPARSMSAFTCLSKAPELAERQSLDAGRPHWRINSSGLAERSTGDGAWQAVLQNEKSKMRVVAVFGNDVWVGGEGLKLYHSSDNGTTWSLVFLPGKGSDGHAIMHVVFQTPQAGSVEADDGTSWTTVDGGKTWN
jgi:Putative zinc-finger